MYMEIKSKNEPDHQNTYVRLESENLFLYRFYYEIQD